MKNLLISIKIFICLSIITCIIYPLLVTGIAAVAYPLKSNGSMIIKNDSIIGSELIGQQFTKPEYFWGRPSAINNNPIPSGASNLNPLGEKLNEIVEQRIDTIRKYHGNIEIGNIPKDLLFASGSGVDPHISPEAAYFQVERVADYRHFNKEQIDKLKDIIETSIETPDLFILGERRINVLKLNLKLTEIK